MSLIVGMMLAQTTENIYTSEQRFSPNIDSNKVEVNVTDIDNTVVNICDESIECDIIKNTLEVVTNNENVSI